MRRQLADIDHLRPSQDLSRFIDPSQVASRNSKKLGARATILESWDSETLEELRRPLSLKGSPLAMSAFSRFAFCAIIYGLVFALCFCTAVRSEYDKSSAIRLPSEGDNAGGGDDLCSGTVTGAACPVKCFRTDPVCGVDGVTYWCGCADALCAGTRVAKRGFCDVSDGGSASLSGQAFLLVHIVWLLLLGFSVLFGLL